MAISALVWALAASAAVLGGGLAFWRSLRRPVSPSTSPIAPLLIASLAAALLGLGWRAWQARAWPGAEPADALALLAGGALIVGAWMHLRVAPFSHSGAQALPLGATLLAVGVLLGLAAGLSWREPAPAATFATGSWLFGLRSGLGGLGLGGWLPTASASLLWRMQTSSARHRLTGATSPAADPGRATALFSYPWLIAAVLAGETWGLAAFATLGGGDAASFWLLAACALGAAYLQTTSSRRPSRLPAWLPPVLAALTVIAALLAAANAGSLM